MTTAQTNTVALHLSAAAAAVAQSWGLADEFDISEPSSTAPDLAFADQAASVTFSASDGSGDGELTLIVDAEIAAQLMASPIAPDDLVAAITPALTAGALAIGDITIGTASVLDPAVALQRVLGMEDAGCVTLADEGQVRVVLAIGRRLSGDTDAVADTIPSQNRRTTTDSTVHADRLDLLRGVQMQATVELGRTTMTINELLALRSGAVIELDRAAGAPADLYVNGRLIAHGEVVVVDENYGLRILQVVADEVAR